MKLSVAFRLMSAALLSCALAGCQTAPATDGAGYQLVRFANPVAAKAAALDESAGPAIASNNARCQKDDACRK